MRSHVAILCRKYLDLILSGDKTIESRLSRVRGPVFGVVQPGDTIYLKQSSGPFRAKAAVSHALHQRLASPSEVASIRAQFGREICGTPEYWLQKADARYCSLVWLTDVEPFDKAPPYRRWRGFGPRAAWIVGPLRRVTSG